MAGPDPRGRRRLRVAAGLTLAVLATACGSDGPPEVAAFVGPARIASVEVDRMLEQYNEASTRSKEVSPFAAAEAPVEPLPTDVGRRYVLDYLIRLEVLRQLATEHGVSTATPDLLQRAIEASDPREFALSGLTPDDLRTGLEAGHIARRLAERLFPEVTVPEDELVRHWETVKNNFRAGWKGTVHAAFLPSAERGEELRRRVAEGQSFDRVAGELGALQAGSMGEVSSNNPQLSPTLVELIGRLHPGETSPPTPAAEGFLVFFLETREDFGARTLDDERELVRKSFADQKRQRLFADWLDDELRRADVRVDSFYGSWNRERGSVSAN